MEHYIKDYRIHLEAPLYCCTIIHTSASQVPENMDVKLLSLSVERQAETDLKKQWQAQMFHYLGDTVMIAQLKNDDMITALTDDCDRFCKYINHVMGAKVTIGIGQACGNIQGLANSYQSAREALSYRVLYGSNQAINMKEIIPQRIIKKESAEEASLANLFKTICLGSGDEIENAVDVYMQHNFYELNSLEKYHVAVMELISELYHFMANNELDTGQLSGGTRSIYNELSNFEPQVLKKWLINFSTTLHDDMDDVRNHSKKSLIDKAREYVHRNYKHEDLGLDDVCRELGVSNSYFSGMFKKETGKSFVAYITDYRMERAARMLVETGEKSYIIAQNVGYADPNYFSYVFKRKYGVSPSKYRTEYEETQI